MPPFLPIVKNSSYVISITITVTAKQNAID